MYHPQAFHCIIFFREKKVSFTHLGALLYKFMGLIKNYTSNECTYYMWPLMIKPLDKIKNVKANCTYVIHINMSYVDFSIWYQNLIQQYFLNQFQIFLNSFGCIYCVISIFSSYFSWHLICYKVLFPTKYLPRSTLIHIRRRFRNHGTHKGTLRKYCF